MGPFSPLLSGIKDSAAERGMGSIETKQAMRSVRTLSNDLVGHSIARLWRDEARKKGPLLER